MNDRKPPYNLDTERVVLGTMVLFEQSISRVMEIINEQTFYHEKHRRIFAAIDRLVKKREAVDMVTVTKELKATNELEIVGIMTVSELCNRVGSDVHIEAHCREIQELAMRREVIQQADRLINRSYADSVDVFNIRDDVKQLNDYLMSETTKGKQVVSVAEVVKLEREEYAKKVYAREHNLPTGISTGFTDMNRVFGGWQPSDLVILAARPAMGKTALALAFARNSNKPVLFFSLEMSALQLTTRLIVMEARVNHFNYKNGCLNTDELRKVEQARGVIECHPLQIEDKAGIDWQELRSKALKAVQGGVGLIIVDYLQLVSVPNGRNRNREAIISEISRELKRVAKDCNVPVIALSQLSRAVESRGEKRPQLSDLRESGAIEQDADIVMFIHRAEYYGEMQDENGQSTEGKAEVIIAKHRNGETGTVDLNWDGEHTLFVDPKKTYISNTLQPNTDFIPKTNDLPF